MYLLRENKNYKKKLQNHLWILRLNKPRSKINNEFSLLLLAASRTGRYDAWSKRLAPRRQWLKPCVIFVSQNKAGKQREAKTGCEVESQQDLTRLQSNWPLVSFSPQVVRVPWQGVPGPPGGASQAPAGGGAFGTAGQISAGQAAGAQRFASSHQQRQPAETWVVPLRLTPAVGALMR